MYNDYEDRIKKEEEEYKKKLENLKNENNLAHIQYEQEKNILIEKNKKEILKLKEEEKNIENGLNKKLIEQKENYIKSINDLKEENKNIQKNRNEELNYVKEKSNQMIINLTKDYNIKLSENKKPNLKLSISMLFFTDNENAYLIFKKNLFSVHNQAQL
jgi:hypothetical protein